MTPTKRLQTVRKTGLQPFLSCSVFMCLQSFYADNRLIAGFLNFFTDYPERYITSPAMPPGNNKNLAACRENNRNITDNQNRHRAESFASAENIRKALYEPPLERRRCRKPDVI